ncbi:MAG: hypothetical protein ORN50_03025 [Crocinitomicaceae bacterium]|nr:hypothetical protein [Crocinitomicaceae bacterium]
MKTIIGIKLFLVLCCQTANDGQYRYEVKSLEDTTQTGMIYSTAQYSEGDTIKLKLN